MRIVALTLVMLGTGCGDDSDSSFVTATTAPKAETTTSRAPTATTLAAANDPSVTAAPPGATTLVMVNFAFNPKGLTISGRDGRVALFLDNRELPPTPSQCARCRDHAM